MSDLPSAALIYPVALIVLAVCWGFWRNPSDYLVQLWTGFVSLFPEKK